MTLHRRSLWLGAVPAIPAILWAPSALGQTVVTNAPPADEAAVVAAPKPVAAPPTTAPATDAMHAAISTGGQFQTGNSHLWAITGQGKYDIRRGNDAFAASVIGNYARSETFPAAATVGTPPPPGIWADSTNNVQGKLRYDRYLTGDASLYMQVTGTHDAFQALTFRLNLDPGFKYLFVSLPATKFWGEIGYDFQYDLHYTNDLNLEQAGAGGLTVDSNGNPYLISQTDTIESSRLFAGFYHSFNKEVSLSTGLEWLQGFGGSGASPPCRLGAIGLRDDRDGQRRHALLESVPSRSVHANQLRRAAGRERRRRILRRARLFAEVQQRAAPGEVRCRHERDLQHHLLADAPARRPPRRLRSLPASASAASAAAPRRRRP